MARAGALRRWTGCRIRVEAGCCQCCAEWKMLSTESATAASGTSGARTPLIAMPGGCARLARPAARVAPFCWPHTRPTSVGVGLLREQRRVSGGGWPAHWRGQGRCVGGHDVGLVLRPVWHCGEDTSMASHKIASQVERRKAANQSWLQRLLLFTCCSAQGPASSRGSVRQYATPLPSDGASRAATSMGSMAWLDLGMANRWAPACGRRHPRSAIQPLRTCLVVLL